MMEKISRKSKRAETSESEDSAFLEHPTPDLRPNPRRTLKPCRHSSTQNGHAVCKSLSEIEQFFIKSRISGLSNDSEDSGKEQEEEEQGRDDDDCINYTGNAAASLIQRTFSVPAETVIQEFGFIERYLRFRSRKEPENPSIPVASRAGNLLPDPPSCSPYPQSYREPSNPEEPMNNDRTVPAPVEVMSTEETRDNQLLDPKSKVPIDVLELFLKKQLPIFLEQQVVADSRATDRLLSLRGHALQWVRHERNELRRKYVEMMAKTLDVESVCRIQLTQIQLDSLFSANQ